MIARLAGPNELDELLDLRRVVFVDEQGVPADLEEDGLDPACTHFVVRDDHGAVVGTARMREYHGSAKAERVAVLASARGTGVGRLLMDALEAEARRQGLPDVRLNAQTSAVPFYERIGYATEGDEFEDAGIPHLAMRKRL